MARRACRPLDDLRLRLPRRTVLRRRLKVKLMRKLSPGLCKVGEVDFILKDATFCVQPSVLHWWRDPFPVGQSWAKSRSFMNYIHELIWIFFWGFFKDDSGASLKYNAMCAHARARSSWLRGRPRCIVNTILLASFIEYSLTSPKKKLIKQEVCELCMRA